MRSPDLKQTPAEPLAGSQWERPRVGPRGELQGKGSYSLNYLRLDRHSARVLIVGLGSTGLSVARFLSKQGVGFAVVDSREHPPGLAELAETLPDAPVFLGGFDQAAFAVATHLVVSPGIPLERPEIKRVQQAGMPMLSDIDLFACMAKAPVAAITGANGKSTVTTLLGLMAKTAGKRVKVGGNLGTPALDLLDDDEPDLYVLELSSFQLERTSLLEPFAAAVLNISPDHLDRYPDVIAYANEKRRIFAGSGIMVLNEDDELVAKMALADRQRLCFSLVYDKNPDYGVSLIDGAEWLMRRSEPLLRSEEVRIKGRHNIANALAALSLGDAMGLPLEPMLTTLRQFPGLEHRMQWVAERAGVSWINDSKATNVGACLAALKGLPGPLVLLAGGDGKGADFSVLAPVAAEKVRVAILMGKDADALQRALAPAVPVIKVNTMRQAVATARSVAKAGDTILLSPACASLDQYRDYQERGRVFMETVRGLRP